MSLQFKIVVPSYNSLPWLEKTLQSIEEQTYPHYDVCVIDDASPDPKMREVIAEYAERNGWTAIYNEVNQKALANIVKGIAALECKDEDVIVLLDGDDWFFNEWVLERLSKIYESKNVLLAHTQHLCWSGRCLGAAGPTSWWTKLRRSYRKARWRYDNLRTFKYLLWRNIRDEDLRDEMGNYHPIAYDVVIMYPMLEMAGSRVRFIPEVFHVYNEARSDNDHKVNQALLSKTYHSIRSREKYHAI